MKTFNFKNAKSVTSEVTRKTTDLPLFAATPTDGNIRLSAEGGKILGVDYDKVMDKEGGQYVDILTTDEGLYAYIVPEEAEDVRGGKLAANAHGANLSFSNKGVYAVLEGVPSDPESETTTTVRWKIEEEGEEYEEDGVKFMFHKLEKHDIKENARRSRKSTEEGADTDSDDEVDFD